MVDAQALRGKRAKQPYYYNRQARDLPPIAVGETVRMRIPGEKRWTAGTCTGTEGPRSYKIRVGGTEYRRNRRHLMASGEPPVREPETWEQGKPENPIEHQAPMQEAPPAPEPPSPEMIPETSTDPPPQPPHMPPLLRRSTRQRTAPDWFTTYVPS